MIKLKDISKRVFRTVFEVGQYFGFNILPNHYYCEIPDIRELKRDNDWKKPCSMIGVHGSTLEDQLDLVRSCCSKHLIERQKRADIYSSACRKNGVQGFGPIEADFLYCFIFQQKPKTILQIGCGVSTAVILMAAEEAGYHPTIICIDPYPTDFLIQEKGRGTIQLIQKKAEIVELDIFTTLGENDLLFIDSTHTVRPGNEVSRVILEVLPRLSKGCWVHFHDIYFPYDYSRRYMIDDLFFQHESIFLHAFLCQNSKFTVRCALSMLHYAKPEELNKFFPNYIAASNNHGLQASEGHFPSSIYLQAVN